MARKTDLGWKDYMTFGFSGYHVTGEDEKCEINYTYFTCNWHTHDPKEMQQRKRGRTKMKREITHT